MHKSYALLTGHSITANSATLSKMKTSWFLIQLCKSYEPENDYIIVETTYIRGNRYDKHNLRQVASASIIMKVNLKTAPSHPSPPCFFQPLRWATRQQINQTIASGRCNSRPAADARQSTLLTPREVSIVLTVVTRLQLETWGEFIRLERELNDSDPKYVESPLR